MQEKRLLCVLSNARSGSTALRSALSIGEKVKDFGEIFHNDRSLTPLPFLEFLGRWPEPLSAIFDASECSKIAHAYLDQVALQTEDLVGVIDIKHNAWGVLRPLWQFPHAEPPFMSALKARQVKFVQLRRENLADQIISYHIATHTDAWARSLQPEDVPESIVGNPLDPVLARRLCLLFERAERLTESYLTNYPHHITLSYEATFENEQLTAEAATRLTDAAGVEIGPQALPKQKNRIDKRLLISNYAEIYEIADEVRKSQVAL